MLTLPAKWTSRQSNLQKDAGLPERNSVAADMDKMILFHHFDPIWWEIGSLSSFQSLRKVSVHDPSLSVWKNALGTGHHQASNLSERFLSMIQASPCQKMPWEMPKEWLGFSRQNMVKSSCLIGMTGKPRISLWFWILCSWSLLEMVMSCEIPFLKAWLLILFCLLQCHWLLLSDDRRICRRCQIDSEYIRNDE